MHEILLASKSPRRKALLTALDLKVQVVNIPEIDESYPKNLSPKDGVAFIANAKANAYLTAGGLITPHQLLLSADTLVALDNTTVLGKPKNRTEAIQMLTLLSNRSHFVYTGVCLINSIHQTNLFTVSTEVFFSKLSPRDIEYYVDTYTPFDKAGSYGIQEWIGHIAISRINGSYSNVVGLPTAEVYAAIQSYNMD